VLFQVVAVVMKPVFGASDISWHSWVTAKLFALFLFYASILVWFALFYLEVLGTNVDVKNNIFTSSSKVGNVKNTRRLKIQLQVNLGKKYQVTAPMLTGAAQNIFNW